MTQESIISQLRTHSILSPFVTCTFYNKFPAESCVAVYLKVLSMQLLSHRGTDWLYPPNPKKHQYFFFPSRKDLLWNYCQQKTFSSYKTHGFIFYTLLCFHSFPHWGLFNEKKTSICCELRLLLSCTKTVLFSKSIIYDDAQQVPSTHCGLQRDYILFFPSKKIQDLKNHLKNTHGHFHWFISNRAKDIKHLRTVRHLTEHCHEGKYSANHVLPYVWDEMRCYKYTLQMGQKWILKVQFEKRFKAIPRRIKALTE